MDIKSWNIKLTTWVDDFLKNEENISNKSFKKYNIIFSYFNSKLTYIHLVGIIKVLNVLL